MDPRRLGGPYETDSRMGECPPPSHSHFYAAWTSRHQSSMIPKALKFATLQKKMAPIPPHT